MDKKNKAPERFVIIMAGGKGERFWPVSREKTPKQLITLLGDKSFLQQTVDRVPVYGPFFFCPVKTRISSTKVAIAFLISAGAYDAGGPGGYRS